MTYICELSHRKKSSKIFENIFGLFFNLLFSWQLGPLWKYDFNENSYYDVLQKITIF